MKGSRQAQEAILLALEDALSRSGYTSDECETGIYAITASQDERPRDVEVHGELDLEVIEERLLEGGWSFSGN